MCFSMFLRPKSKGRTCHRQGTVGEAGGTLLLCKPVVIREPEPLSTCTCRGSASRAGGWTNMIWRYPGTLAPNPKS